MQDQNFSDFIKTTKQYRDRIDHAAPLFGASHFWHQVAVDVHDRRCADPECCGVRDLNDNICNIVFQPVSCHQCYIAAECDELIHGTAHGCMLVDHNKPKIKPFKVDNYSQDDPRMAEALAAKLNQDVQRGWMKMAMDPMSAMHISALFGVDEVTKIREIKDMSAPLGGSVNDSSTVRDHSLPSLKHNLYGQLKPHMYLAKCDVKDAYRNICIHVLQQHLFNFSMPLDAHGQFTAKDEGHGFGVAQDGRLMFGARRAGEYFVRYMTLLQQYINDKIKHLGVTVVYVDDWLILSNDKHKCQQALDILMSIIKAAGLTIKTNKTEGPSQDLIFLGFRVQTTFNNDQVKISVSEKKVLKADDICKRMLGHRAVNAKLLQRCTGFLNHIAEVVFAGSAHLQGLHRLTAQALRKSNGWVTLSQHAKADLNWWLTTLRENNGTNIIIQQPMQWKHFTATDASLFAIGGYSTRGSFAYALTKDHGVHFPSDAPQDFGTLFANTPAGRALPRKLMPSKANGLLEKIAYLELLAIYTALSINLDEWSGKHVPIYTDNTNVVSWLTKNTASSCEDARLLRHILDICAKNNIRLMPTYINTNDNKIADSLSRLKFHEFLHASIDPAFTFPPRLWTPYPVAHQDFVKPTSQAV